MKKQGIVCGITLNQRVAGSNPARLFGYWLRGECNLSTRNMQCKVLPEVDTLQTCYNCA
ncbi:MAG: hypothetical protein Q8P40_14760 [Nitrospirota bacterium]|nr:hypothetical protein [Nitrospirota bacterium]